MQAEVRAKLSKNVRVKSGKSKWGLSNGGLRPHSAMCAQSSTIVHFCGPFRPLSKGNFRRKMTTIVGNHGQVWTSTLNPHLLSPHSDFADKSGVSSRNISGSWVGARLTSVLLTWPQLCQVIAGTALRPSLVDVILN